MKTFGSINTTIVEGKASKSAQEQSKNSQESAIGIQEYWNEGYHCKLVKRSGNIGLFEQMGPFGKTCSFEIIVIQSYRGRECAPSTEEWGKLGWSYTQLECAIRAFDQILTRYKK